MNRVLSLIRDGKGKGTISWFYVTMHIIIYVNKREAVQDVFDNIQNLRHFHPRRNIGGEKGKFLYHDWGPFAMDVIVQIQVAKLHIEKVIRWSQISMCDNRYNIFMTTGFAKGCHSTHFAFYVFPADVAERPDNLSGENLHRLGPLNTSADDFDTLPDRYTDFVSTKNQYTACLKRTS